MLAAMLIASLFVTACASETSSAGNGDFVADGDTPLEPPHVVEPEAPKASFESSRHISALAKLEDGTQYRVRLEVGDGTALSEFKAPEGFPEPAVCTLDSERDLIYPARVIGTSETVDFTIDMPIRVEMRLAPRDTTWG